MPAALQHVEPILGPGGDPSAVAQIIGRVCAQASRPVEYQRGSRHEALDGKTLRGTIPLGETEGMHRLSIYLLADPHHLLILTRGPWGVDNGLHWRRDVTFQEEQAQLRMGHAPKMLVVLNTIVIGLFARPGETNRVHARWAFASHLDTGLAPSRV